MALQTCNRCRKRRIKCDLKLPACGNCAVGDLECQFYDEILDRDVPRSYLHALNQKVRELKLEIKTISNRGVFNFVGGETSGAIYPPSDFHIGIERLEKDSTYCATSYLGPGSSATLAQDILKNAASWCSRQPPQSTMAVDVASVISKAGVQSHHTGLSYSPDVRKVELLSVLPPSSQRFLIELFLKFIQPEYPVLAEASVARLMSHENPVKWSVSHSQEADAINLICILAVSSTLVARDIEPMMNIASTVCRESLRRILDESDRHHQNLNDGDDPLKLILILFFSALCELVEPISDQTYGIVGRALAICEKLRAENPLSYLTDMENFDLLEHCLMKLEYALTFHFRRPSRYCEMWHDSSAGNRGLAYYDDPMTLYRTREKIAQALSQYPRPSAAYFESLVPKDLQVLSAEFAIELQSAVLYVDLHSLFTKSQLNLSSIEAWTEPTMDLLHIIAKSAHTIIDSIVKKNKENKIISVWLEIENLLEAGLVWVFYLIISKVTNSIPHNLALLGISSAVSPLLTCSNLLASLAERWRRGRIYTEVFNTVLELLWTILD